ncbi:MAG: cytochrome c3 family protein [Candidatus Glassbacteria bacterium]
MKALSFLTLGTFLGLAMGLALSTPWAQQEEAGFEMGKVISKQFQEYHTKGVPDSIYVFQTQYKKGTQIVFRHEKHIGDIGLQCVECHHVEACTKCHFKNETHTMHVTEGKIALHENCMGCHAEIGGPTDCDECHHR